MFNTAARVFCVISLSDGVAGEGLLLTHNQLSFAPLEGQSDKQPASSAEIEGSNNGLIKLAFGLGIHSTLVAHGSRQWRIIASTDLYLIPVLALMRRRSAQA